MREDGAGAWAQAEGGLWGVIPNARDRGHATVRARTCRAVMRSCGARDGRHKSPTRSVMRRQGCSSFVLERGGAAAHRSPWGKWWVGGIEEWGQCETYACSSVLSRLLLRSITPAPPFCHARPHGPHTWHVGMWMSTWRTDGQDLENGWGEDVEDARMGRAKRCIGVIQRTYK